MLGGMVNSNQAWISNSMNNEVNQQTLHLWKTANVLTFGHPCWSSQSPFAFLVCRITDRPSCSNRDTSVSWSKIVTQHCLYWLQQMNTSDWNILEQVGNLQVKPTNMGPHGMERCTTFYTIDLKMIATPSHSWYLIINRKWVKSWVDVSNYQFIFARVKWRAHKDLLKTNLLQIAVARFRIWTFVKHLVFKTRVNQVITGLSHGFAALTTSMSYATNLFQAF